MRSKIPLPLGEDGATRRVRVSGFDETCDPHSPPRRGGVARQPAGWRAGVVSSAETFRRSDHPVCAFAALGAVSLEASSYRARASRPPLRGGEYARPNVLPKKQQSTDLFHRPLLQL